MSHVMTDLITKVFMTMCTWTLTKENHFYCATLQYCSTALQCSFILIKLSNANSILTQCISFVECCYSIQTEYIDHISFERNQDGSKSWLIASGISRFRRDVRLPFAECNTAVNSREITWLSQIKRKTLPCLVTRNYWQYSCKSWRSAADLQ